MYLVKYIFVNIVYHSYTILFIAVSIKNIVDMSGNKHNSLKHMHVCHSLDVTAVWQDTASAVWRVYAARNPATAVAKVGKFPPFWRKTFPRRPPVFCTFSVVPLVVYNCVL